MWGAIGDLFLFFLVMVVVVVLVILMKTYPEGMKEKTVRTFVLS